VLLFFYGVNIYYLCVIEKKKAGSITYIYLIPNREEEEIESEK